MNARTNFAQYSHQQLYSMLMAGDSATARTAAEKWQTTGIGLNEQADKLDRELHEFNGSWTGGAADKYKTMITDLVGGMRKVAQTAHAMRNLIEDSADALDKAKTEMPPPVDVPTVSPTDLSLAANPPTLPADASQETVMAAARQRAAAVNNVNTQQQAAANASAAHTRAVQVMTDLAGNYDTAEESIPASPNAVNAPSMPGGGGAGSVGGSLAPGGVEGGGPATVVGPGNEHTLPGETPGGVTDGGGAAAPGDPAKPASPLFGDMFTAGLAAASAAAFGRFGSIMPRVPAWANPKKPDDKTGEDGKPSKLGSEANLGGTGGDVPGTDLGAIGGGGSGFDPGSIGGGSIGDAGGMSTGQVPAAHAGLSGAPGTGNALSSLAGGAAGAAGAAAAKGMMPMMPMMPMGMGMGGDMGGGRRIPPWLVETEDVWGESSVVAPSVIGVEPDAGAR